MIDLKPLVNKTVDFAYRGARLGFDLSHALFSSFAIDTGTRLLLKEIAHDELLAKAESILDAGCGVGILGISLAASCPGAKVVMRDRDILACAFSERNCWRNGIPAKRLDLEGNPVEAILKRAPKHKENEERLKDTIIAPGLLGDDDPLGPYDFIVSNLPAKAGPTILSRFIEICSSKLLNPGGRLGFVIVNTLAGFADEWCASSGMILVKKTIAKSHTVFLREKKAEAGSPAEPPELAPAQRPADGGPEGDRLLPYRRSSASRRLGRYSVHAEGYWGLPEFDTTSFATSLAVEALERACAGSLVRDFLIAEPGIGLAALWAGKALGPARIHAASRDLLSLRATKANIEASGGPTPEFLPLQSIDIGQARDAMFDAILWHPDEIPEYDSISPAWEFLKRAAKMGAAIVIVASATTIARFERIKPAEMQRLGEKRSKGFAALMVRRIA